MQHASRHEGRTCCVAEERVAAGCGVHSYLVPPSGGRRRLHICNGHPQEGALQRAGAARKHPERRFGALGRGRPRRRRGAVINGRMAAHAEAGGVGRVVRQRVRTTPGVGRRVAEDEQSVALHGGTVSEAPRGGGGGAAGQRRKQHAAGGEIQLVRQPNLVAKAMCGQRRRRKDSVLDRERKCVPCRGAGARRAAPPQATPPRWCPLQTWAQTAPAMSKRRMSVSERLAIACAACGFATRPRLAGPAARHVVSRVPWLGDGDDVRAAVHHVEASLQHRRLPRHVARHRLQAGPAPPGVAQESQVRQPGRHLARGAARWRGAKSA